MADLPHSYPFRFVERRPGAPPTFPLTVGAALPGPRIAGRRGGAGPAPASLLLEAMAQAVLADPPGGGEERGGGGATGGARLAGIEAARFHADVRPGDRLTGRSEVQGRFGPALKVRCTLERDGETVAEATLLLTLG